MRSNSCTFWQQTLHWGDANVTTWTFYFPNFVDEASLFSSCREMICHNEPAAFWCRDFTLMSDVLFLYLVHLSLFMWILMWKCHEWIQLSAREDCASKPLKTYTQCDLWWTRFAVSFSTLSFCCCLSTNISLEQYKYRTHWVSESFQSTKLVSDCSSCAGLNHIAFIAKVPFFNFFVL